MVSAAIARGTSAAGSGAHPFSFTVDGLDLVDYLDMFSVEVEASAMATDTWRARFTLVNHDNALDFLDYWGIYFVPHAHTVAYPLREVRLHDNTRDEPIFGGFVTGLRIVLTGGGLTSRIHLDCIGYGILLDYTWLPVDFVADTALGVPSNSQAVLAQCAVGDLSRARGTWTAVAPGASVSVSGSFMGPLTISAGTSARQAIIALAEASAQPIGLWVDQWKRIHIVQDSIIDTTLGPVSVFGSARGSEQAVEAVFDFSEYVTDVFLTGGNAAGTGWYHARHSGGFSSGPQTAHTYNPPRLAIQVSQAASLDENDLIDYSAALLASRQAGAYPTHTYRVSGFYGWYLGRRIEHLYGVLGGVGSDEVLGQIVGYRLTFERTATGGARPVYELRSMSQFGWGVGGFTTALAPTDTTAQYTKNRLQVRTS
jgi:hypothetical protein